jgi:hypothetical protein
MTYYNQTKELTNWFLNLPLDKSIDNKRYKIWSLNSRPHEAQLEDQKAKKSSKRSSKRRKTVKSNKRHEKRQNHEKSKKRSKPKQKPKIYTPLNQTSSNTLNASSSPLDSLLSCFFSQPSDYQEFNQLYA